MEVRRPEFDQARAMMSSADDDPTLTALNVSRVGGDLRAARLRLGWTLEDVAHGLRIRLPLPEPHDLAGAQINRGINQEAHANPTKFSNILSPTACDFSGWNCVA